MCWTSAEFCSRSGGHDPVDGSSEDRVALILEYDVAGRSRLLVE